MKKYSDEQLKILLKELLSYPTELRWLEWKHCNDDPDTIGRYISALANSACVENREFGYMIWALKMRHGPPRGPVLILHVSKKAISRSKYI